MASLANGLIGVLFAASLGIHTIATVRIRAKGIPHRLRGGAGDQLVEVVLEVPTELSDKARTLIEELGKELGEDVQPQQRTFVEKLKNLFG